MHKSAESGMVFQCIKAYEPAVGTSVYLLDKKAGNRTADDYNGAELREFNNYKVGMVTSFNGKSMVICSKRARMKG